MNLFGKTGKKYKKKYMILNSYSQVGQDTWVLEKLNNKKNGYFLEIGAYDGVKFSNTYLLENKYGWKGICVEAHPENYQKLISNRSCQCFNVALDDKQGEVFMDKLAGTGSKISQTGFLVKSTTFKLLFLENEVPKKIDYMSIDIEGNEYKALIEFPYDEYYCDIITVEHNSYIDGGTNKYKIMELLTKNDYEISVEDVKSDGLTFEDWYVHKKFKN
jgi:FkbM family methyltransferase